MGIFSKKLNSSEFEILLKKIVLVVSDIDLLKSKFAAMDTNMNSLRGLVNRKFGDYGEVEEDIKSPDGLDSLRQISKDGGSNSIGNSEGRR